MIEHGAVSFEEVVDLISGQERLWVRMGVARGDEGWTVLAYDLVAPIEPPSWQNLTWDYPAAIFHSFSATGEVVAQWLKSGQIPLHDRDVTLSGLPREPPNEQVRVTGLASKQQWGGYEPLPWPTNCYELSSGGQRPQSPQNMLISADSPSFLRFDNAAAAFFNLTSNQSLSQLPTPLFRFQDLTGRVARVTVHPAKVDVEVEGSALDKLTIELAGRVPGPHALLSGSQMQEHVFLTPDGLHRESWIVLKSDSTCVDRKFLNWPYATTPNPDVDVAVEPLSVIEALVAQGEGPALEFKRDVPAEPEARRKVCRTLAAFANGCGGHVLFGVDDTGQMLGVSADEASAAGKDTVTRWITDLVVPHPPFTVESIDVAGARSVLHVAVEEGPAPPYAVDPAKPRYYIRRGATTFPAAADDVRVLARSRPPMAEPVGFGPFGWR